MIGNRGWKLGTAAQRFISLNVFSLHFVLHVRTPAMGGWPKLEPHIARFQARIVRRNQLFFLFFFFLFSVQPESRTHRCPGEFSFSNDPICICRPRFFFSFFFFATPGPVVLQATNDVLDYTGRTGGLK